MAMLGNISLLLGLFITMIAFTGAVDAVTTPKPRTAVQAAANAVKPPEALAPADTQREYNTKTYFLSDIGAGIPLSLSGTIDGEGVWFHVRSDEIVRKASLKLKYSFSPALIQELSHIKVLVNEEVIDTIPLPKDQAGKEQSREIALDTRYITSATHVRFQLVGHYTMECEDPLHSSIWASISNKSQIILMIEKINLPTELSLLPEPFFDKYDTARLNLPFIIEETPGKGAIEAAGILATWFAAQASYHGTHFPVVMNQAPATHSIILATNDKLPAFLKLGKIEGPKVIITSKAEDPAIKYLILTGRDDKEMVMVAQALVLGQGLMSGQVASIRSVKLPDPRQAYDAPNWIRTDRPVKLGELVKEPSELQVYGRKPNTIRIKVRVPADLMVWQDRSVPLNLNYRYTPPAGNGNTALNFSINDSFIKAMYMKQAKEFEGDKEILIPVRDDESKLFGTALIPAFNVGSDNFLEFRYVFGDYREGACTSSSVDGYRAAIDPDSTLDFSKYYHYAALPNLNYFISSGFPFTKFSDLSQTTILLPEKPSVNDLNIYLALLAVAGNSTGMPALRFNLVLGQEIDGLEDTDMLIMDSHELHPLLKKWALEYPVILDHFQRTVGDNFAKVIPFRLFDYQTKDSTFDANGNTDFMVDDDLSLLMGLESPISSGKSVIAFLAGGSRSTANAVGKIEDTGLSRYIKGDLAVFREKEVISYDIGDKYYTGKVPLWIMVWFHASNHPYLLSIAGLIAGLILALISHRFLLLKAGQRLQELKNRSKADS